MIEAENDDSIPNKRFKYYDESEENCSSVENVLSTSEFMFIILLYSSRLHLLLCVYSFVLLCYNVNILLIGNNYELQ